ncbi:hypothetical protein ACTACD_21010 [Pseudomonas syringae]|uniref:hypothetical protein n=1 Tax=Pseudomonas syringae TaxID=317 RepID=UPI003F7667CA
MAISIDGGKDNQIGVWRDIPVSRVLSPESAKEVQLFIKYSRSGIYEMMAYGLPAADALFLSRVALEVEESSL